MNGTSILNFVTHENGISVINIFDISGKSVYKTSEYLLQGIHHFNISGVSIGMYLIRIQEGNYNYSTKLISLSENIGNINIKHISFTPTVNHQKESTMIEDTTIKTLTYHKGNRLEYKATSTTSDKTVIMDVPTTSKTVHFNFVTCNTGGDNYSTISFIKSSKSKTMSDTITYDTIVWMQQNMNVGTRINGGSFQDTTGGIIKKYCWNNLESNCDKYGGLYQWGQLMQFDTTRADSLNPRICPIGWHVSTNYDWYVMMTNIDTSFLWSDTIAGGKLKEMGTIHWTSPNPASDSIGFTALPGGLWNNQASQFQAIDTGGCFWTSKKVNFPSNSAVEYELHYYDIKLQGANRSMLDAISVRCVKN